MKVIIAGCRYKDLKNKIIFDDYSLLLRAIEESGYDITEVVCGMAIGVDQMGDQWAISKNIDVKLMPANWQLHGKAAGPIRNKQMAEYCDAAIILWDGKSAGTRNMIDNMIKLKKPYTLKMTSSSVLDFM